MRKGALLAAVLLAAAAPVWAYEKTYNGSVDPTTDGWSVWDSSVLQGSVFDEGGGNSSWLISDASDKKTKLQITGGVSTNPDVGVYVEGRIKCTNWNKDAGGDDTPLNLGLQIYYVYPGPSTYKAGHWLTVRPDRLMMRSSGSRPTSYSGTFGDYHTYRLVYKRLELRTRGTRTDAWAVYVDGASPVPVLHSWTNGTQKDFGGPTFGAGNTGNVQDVSFDWIYYTDAGAYPPGMDGTVRFTNGDPDATAAADGQSFSVTWQTNVPTTGELRYSIQGDNSFSSVVTDPTLSTTHTVNVTNATPGATYEYIAVSTDTGDKKAISLPASVTLPNPFYISAGPTVAVANDGLSATITWSTNLADLASEVHWGPDANCSNVTVEPGAGGVTQHSVTIPVQPASKYYFYAKSTSPTWPAAQSGVMSFFVVGETLLNPGFEDGVLDPWVKVNPFDGVFNTTNWGVPSHTGTKWAGSKVSYGKMDLGHIYQKVKTIPGRFYEAKVWIWTRHQAEPPGVSQPTDVACAIGIDPAGGTNAAATTVVWSDWTETANANTDGDTGPGGPWTEISVAAKATGTEATLYLIQTHKWALQWNINGFDDASWSLAPPPPNDIGATKRLKNGYPAELTGKVVTGAFENPDTHDTFFYIEEADRSAGIKVKWSGPVNAGELRNVSGTVATESGEKIIVADAVGPETPQTGDIPAPLAMNNLSIVRSFGGQALAAQGLLVKAWGRVRNRTATQFYLDDGTNYCDDTTFDWQGIAATGVRVYLVDSTVNEGDYAYVVGCPGNVWFEDNSDPANPRSFAVPAIWATTAVTIPER